MSHPPPETATKLHRALLDAGSAPTAERVGDLVRRAAPLLADPDASALRHEVAARVHGLGTVGELLDDETVSDVLINGPGPVWVERHGRVEPSGHVVDEATLDHLIERVVAPLGRRVDRYQPVVDARLPDGSRVQITVPPVAVDGPYLAIRRFRTRHLTLDAFTTERTSRRLVAAVSAGATVLVCGGTGAGKTTLLNALARHLPPTDRVVTIEDAAELRLPGEHVVRLETRPSTADGLPAVTMRDLVRAALRLRPDRIVVGEVRGAEAFDLLQALNTGHGGSLSTCHANSPDDALLRVEAMAMTAGVDLPLDVVRHLTTRAIDLIVHVARADDGRRRITAVHRVESEAPDVATTPLAL